jgi:aerobic-type carbon monoxide dehydrogenase small subunit (CoxS/CutS family)
VTSANQHVLHFELNGSPREVTVRSNRRLIDLLRDDLGLTGTKEGCSVGVCGACSVLVDGQVMSACLMPAVFVDGARVTTIEGLAPDPEHLTPVQDAFIRHGGFQCGICTPGQIIAATALLAETAHPSVDQIKEWMMGNLCRCTGYYKIIESIQAAADADQAPVAREAVGVRI